MANTINDALVDKIYAMALKALRVKTATIGSVFQDPSTLSNPSQKFGKVIIPIPAPYPDATDITPSSVAPNGNDTTPEYAEFNLSNWKESDFHLTDYEMSRLQAGTMGMQMEEAIDALSRTIVKSVLDNYKGVYQHTGTPGTTPFASTTAAARSARKMLNAAGTPMAMRSLLLGFDAEENALGLPNFEKANEAGTNQIAVEAIIGRRVGFDWRTEGYMPTFTGGTLSDGTNKAALIDSAAVAVGDISVDMDETTLTGTLLKGDLFTVAGDTQQYVVTADATAAGNSITVSFSPAAKVAWADNAQVTFVANHEVSALAMGYQAIAFASRPLITEVGFSGGNIIRQIPDPHSGLVLNMEISREHYRTKVSFSCLWGSTLARPQSAVRILG